MKTLLLERVCLLTFCTILVFANVGEHRGMKGLRWFAASNVGYLIGGILIASRQHVPVWAAVVLANLLYSMGYVFLHRCLAGFFGEKRWMWWAHVGVAALSLTQCIYFTLIHSDIRLRLAAIGLATGMQFVLCAMVAFGGAKTAMRSAATGMGAVLAFSATLNLTRLLLTLIWGTTTVYLKADDIQTTTVMLNTTIFVAIDIAFVWIVATSLRNELQLQATTDPLTKVLNRRALESIAQTAVETSHENGHPLSAMVLDLDNFKEINDSMGHRAGDLALIDVAECLKKELRDSDAIARVGGDEFVIILPNCSRNRAHEVAERLRAALEARDIAVGNELVHVQASFGVATLEDSGKDWGLLIADCDRALYTAKSVGGNFVYVS